MSNIPDCPFCRDNNLLKGDVLAESAGGYLIMNQFSPGNYLIIPSEHAESPLELPDTWWHDVKTLLAEIPDLPEHYNISLNRGQHAGQTVRHLHFWVIPRLPNGPASGKGLATLIDAVNRE